MKKLFLLFFVSSYVFAQDVSNQRPYITAQRKMVCFDLDAVWEAAKNLKQELVWVGKDEEGQNYALLVSKKEKHFSIVVHKENIGCVLGGGHDFRFGKSFEVK